jgi:hypothetical protein
LATPVDTTPSEIDVVLIHQCDLAAADHLACPTSATCRRRGLLGLGGLARGHNRRRSCRRPGRIAVVVPGGAPETRQRDNCGDERGRTGQDAGQRRPERPEPAARAFSIFRTLLPGDPPMLREAQ